MEQVPHALPARGKGLSRAQGLRLPGVVHVALSHREASPSSGLSHEAGEERAAGHE